MFWKRFENTKGIIRSRNSKDRQHNGKRKRDKITNKDIQNTTQKNTPLKAGYEPMFSERTGSSCNTSGTRRVTLVTTT